MNHTLSLPILTLSILGLASPAFGQQAKIEGDVHDDKDRPVASVRIVVTPGGQAGTTDGKGHFVIHLPDNVRPGQAARSRVARAGWVIFNPIFGKCETKLAGSNFEPLPVVIVPRGSLLALSPKRISQVVAQWAQERSKQAREIDRLRGEVNSLNSDLSQYDFLQKYAEEYGFTLDKFIAAAEQWAQTKEGDDKEEQALKEYWRKNYQSAKRLAMESAEMADAELDEANRKRSESGGKLVRRLILAGNSAYADNQFREALDAYGKLDSRFESGKLAREGFEKEWAGLKVLIGNARAELGIRAGGAEGAQHLSGSLAAYQQAGTFYTREQSPQDWAAIQNNLGVVFHRLATRAQGADSRKHLHASEAAFRAALEVRTRALVPQDWATTQNSLGNLLSTLGGSTEGPEGARHLSEAVAAYRAALEVLTRAQHPERWATTQSNLGSALTALGERAEGADGGRYLREAERAYRAALEVRTRELLPQDWATTQNNLGNVLWDLSARTDGPESARYLHAAAAAYRAALEVRTREHMPQDWAATQYNLSNVLNDLGRRAEGTESIKYLRDSVDAARAALEVLTRAQMPQQWALVQHNLGGVLSDLGERTEGPDGVKALREAAAALRAALEVRTRESMPENWAATQNNLGTALLSLGGRAEGTDRSKYLDEAEGALRAALEVRTRERLPQDWAQTRNNLGIVYFLRNDLAGASEIYLDVLQVDPDDPAAYRSAAEINHELLFNFEQAFTLNQQWVTRHPDDLPAKANFAEANFTVARFAESQQLITALLSRPEISGSTRVALLALDVTSLIALEQRKQVPGRLDALVTEVSRQPAGFKLEWNFNGTRHFINHSEKLVPHRSWLGKLLDALAGEDRDKMLKSLREVQAEFKK